MAHSRESALPKQRGGLLGRAFSRSLEYLAILALAGAAVALVGYFVHRDQHKTPALFTGRHFPTCRDAGIAAGSTLEGTCTTSHALITVGNQGTLLTVPGLTARANDATVTEATTPSGKARHRIRVSVDFTLRNTGSEPLFGLGRDPQLRLTIGNAQARPDGAVMTQKGAFTTHTSLAPNATRTGFLHFELAGATSQAFQRAAGSLGLTVSGPGAKTARLAVIRIHP